MGAFQSSRKARRDEEARAEKARLWFLSRLRRIEEKAECERICEIERYASVYERQYRNGGLNHLSLYQLREEINRWSYWD